jgi:olefin beta-lactone synthetase
VNLAERLDHRAQVQPQAPAIIEGDRVVRFDDLAESVRRSAAWFRKLGVEPGDAVLVFVPMSAALYQVLLAIIRLGAVAMFADPSSGRAHLGRCCRILPPKAFVGIPKAHLLRFITAELRHIPISVVMGGWAPFAHRLEAMPDDAPRSQVQAFPCVQREDSDPALITFTSGSTGEPKAAARSHGFLLAQHAVLADTLRHEEGLLDLTTLPIFGLANLASGQTTVLPNADLRRPGFINPNPVLDQITRLRPATTAASPAFLERLVDGAEARGVTLDSFRSLYTGGAPVFPNLLDKVQKAAPQAEVVAVYGSTEAEPIAEIARSAMSEKDLADMRDGKGLLVGPAVAQIQLRVIQDRWGSPRASMSEETFTSLFTGQGEVGEIVVSGGHVLSGYLHGKGDSETKFRVAGKVWHRTGDAGYLDAQQRLWLLGRCSARVRDNRGELYPFAVECAAMANPSVRRAALAALDGARILAVEGSGIDTASLRVALAWAQLDEVRLMSSIPMDLRHNAKVDYPELTRRLRKTS